MTRFVLRSRGALLAAAVFGVAVPALVAGPATSAFAQAGVTIEAIEFEGNQRYSDDTLRLSLRTKVGQVLDRALLNEDIHTLYQFFDTVEPVEKTTDAGGVRITFRVTENPPVSEVAYVGVSGLSQPEVEAVVETSTGRPLADFRLENDKRKIERLYKSRGWHFVQVNARAEPVGGGRRVVFEVLEGPRVSIANLEFAGNASFPEPKLLDGAQMITKEKGFLGMGGSDFVEETLRQDLLQVRQFYRSEGYLDAEVTLGSMTPSADRREMSIVVNVAEGQPYTVGSISVEGVRTFPGGAEALRPLVVTAEGKRVRTDDLRRTAEAMDRAYREEGFFSAVVTPVTKHRPQGNVVDVVFSVEEASKIRIRNLNIHGNVVTQDKVIRRALSMAPGDVLNQNEIDKSIRRLRSLQYFDRVQARVAPVAEGEDPNQQDITFEVDDTAPTGQIRFAVGATSDFGFIGELTISKRNFDWKDWPTRFGDVLSGRAFTGAGQEFYLTLSPGTERSSYALGFTEPWVFDKPISFSWNVFLRQFRRFEYDEDNRGASVTFGRRFTWEGREKDTELSLAATTRFESHDVDGISRDSAPTAFLAEGKNTLLAERISARLERIDSPRFPTDGWYGQVSAEMGFSGDVQLWKTGLEAGRFWPIWKTEDERVHTLSVTSSFGYAQPLGSSDEADANLFDEDYVPIYESYFAGGSSSVRGFSFGGAGAHGEGNPFIARKPGESNSHRNARLGRVAQSVLENDGDPLGGSISFTASAEYALPLYEDLLRGVLFVDAGTARESFDSSHGLDEDAFNSVRSALLASNSPAQRRLGRSLDFDEGESFFGDLRVGVGIGLRIRIPQLGPVPIALDFGFPVREQDGDDTQVVSFSIERRF